MKGIVEYHYLCVEDGGRSGTSYPELLVLVLVVLVVNDEGVLL
jgi:hypothetical protein